MIALFSALVLHPAWARSIQILDRPALARCVAQLYAAEVTPSDDAALVTGRLHQLAKDREEAELSDEAVAARQVELLPDVATDFQTASKPLIDASHLRLRQMLDDVAAKDAVSVVHVRRGADDITKFLDDVDGLTGRVDQKLRDTKVRKFSVKETLGKAVALAAAVGVGWAAHRQGLTSDAVFGVSTVFPALVTGFYMTLRRVTYLASLWRKTAPPLDQRRMSFDNLVGAVRGALVNPPSERPRTLHFGTSHMFTPEFARALRRAQTLDQIAPSDFVDFARSRRHLIWSYLRNIATLQLGQVDYIFTAATPEEPATLITVARLRRIQAMPTSGGRRGPPPPTRRAPDAGLAPAGA